MDAIAAQMAELRGLTLGTPITRTVMTRQELGAFLEAKLAEEYPPEEVEKDVLVLSAFDFVDADYDLRQVLLDLYSEEILGLYDDELDTFYIISDGEFSLLDQLTVAHEYVHALQDQNLGLDTFADDEQVGDDALLARMALVEGDASLAMTQYLLARRDEISAEEWASLLAESSSMGEQTGPDVPAIIRETFDFPYLYGVEFVSLLQDGGWPAVDAAFADPPQSTEQILHPEKYLTPDEPQLLALPPLTDTLGSGWQLLEAETLGEFQSSLYLAQQVDEDTADRASQGWDGDQYAVYSKDGTTVLAFTTVWDSPTDRQEFVAAYQQYATQKHGQPPTRSSETETWWETPSQTTLLTWEGDTALVLAGPDRETVQRVLAAIAP
jgi:Zn-dependent peptidase ImmA (M78 family)